MELSPERFTVPKLIIGCFHHDDAIYLLGAIEDHKNLFPGYKLLIPSDFVSVRPWTFHPR